MSKVKNLKIMIELQNKKYTKLKKNLKCKFKDWKNKFKNYKSKNKLSWKSILFQINILEQKKDIAKNQNLQKPR